MVYFNQLCHNFVYVSVSIFEIHTRKAQICRLSFFFFSYFRPEEEQYRLSLIFISKRVKTLVTGSPVSGRLDQSHLSENVSPLLLPPPPSHPRCSPWQRDVALQNRTSIYVTARPVRGERSAWKEGSGRRGGAGLRRLRRRVPGLCHPLCGVL